MSEEFQQWQRSFNDKAKYKEFKDREAQAKKDWGENFGKATRWGKVKHLSIKEWAAEKRAQRLKEKQQDE
jgi:hypothetical protein